MQTTVRPLLSAEIDHPCFLRPKNSTPNLYEVQSEFIPLLSAVSETKV